MKITFQKIILNIAPTIIINLFGIILLNYMFKDYTYILIITYLFLSFYSILPTLFLTWNYYLKNQTLILQLDKDKIEISYNNLNHQTISIEEIDFISFVGLKNNFEKYNIRFSTFDNYYYIKIQLLDSFQVILTSLLKQNLREQFYANYPNLNYCYKNTSFPFIK